MGSSTSKPSETRVFQPKTPVDFSETLLSQLESSNETNFTRKQLGERFVEQRVANRLAELEDETLKKFENKLDDSLIKKDDEKDPLTSQLLNEKVGSLDQRLAALKEKDDQKHSKFANHPARQQLTACLLENKGKPLNCYNQIENFKKLVEETS
ncbi:hypothetical protein ZYGR_0AV00460 [Zygosaccharomyces rouxii]|uniref:MICOS complex subunit MIC19 n=1 Tax=Zygosaccharomyces rouxii TaxID=4956 RepID=A0A1Q3AID3_ZYGRO|nr:hypothetical protein ZYGR_0AV00460 [Zygosaccharomyces rouxii]